MFGVDGLFIGGIRFFLFDLVVSGFYGEFRDF
jgi:hypothetical protein